MKRSAEGDKKNHMFQRVCEVGLEWMALNIKSNLMTKFEWEMNNK